MRRESHQSLSRHLSPLCLFLASCAFENTVLNLLPLNKELIVWYIGLLIVVIFLDISLSPPTDDRENPFKRPFKVLSIGYLENDLKELKNM